MNRENHIVFISGFFPPKTFYSLLLLLLSSTTISMCVCARGWDYQVSTKSCETMINKKRKIFTLNRHRHISFGIDKIDEPRYILLIMNINIDDDDDNYVDYAKQK